MNQRPARGGLPRRETDAAWETSSCQNPISKRAPLCGHSGENIPILAIVRVCARGPALCLRASSEWNEMILLISVLIIRGLSDDGEKASSVWHSS